MPAPATTLDVRPLVLPGLLAYREEVALRRAVAFCDAPDLVCGVEVQPLTPRTWSMLHAVRSRFLYGGQPVDEDVKLYLWFHSPLWCHDRTPGMLRRYRRALAPLNAALHGRWSLLGRSLGHQSIVLARFIDGIGALIDAALADAPGGSGQSGPPPSTLEAQMIHEFAAAYGWAPERTRATPLRQLFQLHRCIRAARGDDISDPREDEIKARHYAARNPAPAS